MTWQRSAPMAPAVAAAAVCSVMLTGASAAAGVRAVPGARPAVLGGTWGTAEEVFGIVALNQGRSASTDSVSCASAGNCSAAGDYTDNSGSQQAFVVSQTGGTWHAAIEMPGIAALSQGRGSFIGSVSCASAGTCSAGGGYTDSSGTHQAFVVSQTGGTWHAAIEVPGTAALNRGGNAAVNEVSCASAGTCGGGGYYADSSGLQQAFVVSQTAGTWGKAIEVPGTAALNRGGNAAINSVSCASAGTCSVGGYYADSRITEQAFVVSQAHGTWRKAIEVPGTAALNRGGIAAINEVSCTSAGNCSAGGEYEDSSRGHPGFVVSQTAGTWGKAIEVPGPAALNQGGSARSDSVSCASAGNCSAGGFYTDSIGGEHAFVVSKT